MVYYYIKYFVLMLFVIINNIKEYNNFNAY